MIKLALAALLGLSIACGGGGSKTPDASDGSQLQCDPLAQTGCAIGEKCTWLFDAFMPQYVGHVGCAPDGTAGVGEACKYGPPGITGVDNCKGGLVCGEFRGDTGICKTICNQSGGSPACDGDHVCVTYSDLFSTGASTPKAAGVCDHVCDPIADNDFDGSASDGPGAFSRRGSMCGSAANIGCYGRPSGGVEPPTAFSCTKDRNFDKSATNGGTGLRHRMPCTTTTGCRDTNNRLSLNSCNQGYVPLIEESTEVSTRICVAICKPANCYSGNCGANDVNAAGAEGDGCRAGERVFAGASGTWSDPGAEHCRFTWYDEIDRSDGTFVPSKFSNTTGLCYSHHAYKFDKDGDPGTGVSGREAVLPDCKDLPDGNGSGTNPSDPDYFGAAELGCVDTVHAGLGPAADGKRVRVPQALLDKVRALDLPRPLYDGELDLP